MGGSLFGGLQTALSALEAQQAVLDTTAHNVANVNTPGFAREQVILQANPGTPSGLGQGAGPLIGNGVQVVDVQRVVSHFLNQQNWTTQGQLSAATQDGQTLSQVQGVLNEPSSSGLNSTLSAFWNAWQNLGNNPQSMAARQQVVSSGQSLATGFANIASSWTSLQGSLNSAVGQDAQKVTNLASQIATLNGQIAVTQGTGQSANDLKDTRDQLVSELAQYVPVSVAQSSAGMVNVSVGSVQLVAGQHAGQLVATADSANHGYYALTWNGATGIPATLGSSGGILGALVHLRDQVIPGYTAQLNTLAGDVAAAVNKAQASGYSMDGTVTGLPFFVASNGGAITASTLEVNPTLVSTPADLAAASAPYQGPGDGSNAQAIGNLTNASIVGGTTASDAYSALVGQIASDTSAANSSQSNLQALQTSIQQQQQSVSGVSINSEMTRMVQAQNAYAAAAKLSSTIDQMLGDLISMVQ